MFAKMTHFNKFLRGIFLALLLVCFCGCSNIQAKESYIGKVDVVDATNIWDKIGDQRNLDLAPKRALVNYYTNKYRKDALHISSVSKSAAPYIFYIVQELKRRHMPLELALLPMVESGFKPTALSSKGAGGIWQMWPITAKRFGLQKDSWYDGRRDIMASTNAALDYLEFLEKKFAGDWLLALAAYNAGEGRIQAAIARNKALRRPTDFWSIKLPNETRNFVPKFLALNILVREQTKHMSNFGIIANQPYFQAIEVGQQIDLKFAAKLAKMSYKDLVKLNPAYLRDCTHPDGPQVLLLPVENAYKFEFNLASLSRVPGRSEHTIKPGDNLTTLATRYNSTISSIMKANNISDANRLRVGQSLIIPIYNGRNFFEPAVNSG